MGPIVQVGRVSVVKVAFTAKIKKVGVVSFQKKCSIQFGHTDNGENGITFDGHVDLELLPSAKGKIDWGMIEIVQNTNYDRKRTPPLHPDPAHKRSHECCTSSGQWQLDAVSHTQTGHEKDNHIMGQDSPAIFLEENGHIFERVDMDDQFRTYLCWNVKGARHILARIDWSCKGTATATGTQGQCTDNALQQGWGLLRGSAAQQASPAAIGASATPPEPVFSPQADPTKWVLC